MTAGRRGPSPPLARRLHPHGRRRQLDPVAGPVQELSPTEWPVPHPQRLQRHAHRRHRPAPAPRQLGLVPVDALIEHPSPRPRPRPTRSLPERAPPGSRCSAGSRSGQRRPDGRAPRRSGWHRGSASRASAVAMVAASSAIELFFDVAITGSAVSTCLQPPTGAGIAKRRGSADAERRSAVAFGGPNEWRMSPVPGTALRPGGARISARRTLPSPNVGHATPTTP